MGPPFFASYQLDCADGRNVCGHPDRGGLRSFARKSERVYGASRSREPVWLGEGCGRRNEWVSPAALGCLRHQRGGYCSGTQHPGHQAVLGFLPLFRPETTQALLLGLGGGHVARDLKSKGIETDAIEIDPAVADAAGNFFGFWPTGAFIVGDARYEIKRLPHRYDYIMHDCFTGGSEPTQLLTREMLMELRALLNECGILALNYVGFTTGEGSEAVASVHRTLKSLFPHLRVFTTVKKDFTDFVFLASRYPLELDRTSQNPRAQWLLEQEYVTPITHGIIITDDYNPLKSWQVRKSETYRKLFM